MDKLRDFLKELTKNNLLDAASDYGIRGLSNLKKEKLIDKLETFLLDENHLRQYLYRLSNEQMILFRKAIERPFQCFEFEKIRDIIIPLYAHLDNSLQLIITNDVKAIYNKINTQEFRRVRETRLWSLECLNFASRYYVIFTSNDLFKLFRLKKLNVKKEELPALLKDIYDLDAPFYYEEKEDLFFSNMTDDFISVRKLQSDKPICIPTIDEINSIFFKGYIDMKEIHSLEIELSKYMDVTNARNHLRDILSDINDGVDPSQILRNVTEEIVFDNIEEVNTIASYIFQIYNNTKQASNYGHSPNELRRKMRSTGPMTIIPGSTAMANLLRNSKDEIEQLGVTVNLEGDSEDYYSNSGNKKIYPNDLCPCGSRKKYKNCCGK